MDRDLSSLLRHWLIPLVMFRAGVISGPWSNNTGRFDPGLSANQTISAVQTQTLNTFHSDLRWFAGAAILQILTIVCQINERNVKLKDTTWLPREALRLFEIFADPFVYQSRYWFFQFSGDGGALELS